MLIERKTTAEGVIIGIWHIVETENQLLSLFEQPERLKQQIAAISNTEKRCEKLAVRALLHDLTGDEKSIGYLPDGKPYLPDGSFNISISHTKNYACVILHSTQIVGIDIEAKTPRAARIQQRFLSPAEFALSNQTPGFVVPLLFWTAKEALYKLASNPALDFVSHIQVIDINWNDQIMTASIASIDHPFKLFFTIEPDYVLSYVCSSTGATEIHNLV
jgi:4'-phosphopantetheinyl transferase EntD